MDPAPDHGEESCSGCLAGKKTVITGADSGIGRAVAIAFAREGTDVLTSHLDEEDDAQETREWVEQAGQEAVLVPGDLADPAHWRAVIAGCVEEFGRVDVLVDDAAFQATHKSIQEIPDEEWDRTLAISTSAFLRLTMAAVPHVQPGASIIATTSVSSDTPPPQLLPYDVIWAGIADMVGARMPLGRPGQPDEASCVSGSRVAVTGGTPIL